MRPWCFALFLSALSASPAFGACHRYTIWRFHHPQPRCAAEREREPVATPQSGKTARRNPHLAYARVVEPPAPELPPVPESPLPEAPQREAVQAPGGDCRKAWEPGLSDFTLWPGQWPGGRSIVWRLP